VKTPRELREEDAALLLLYTQAIGQYRERSGGLPPDREAHLNAWAHARREHSSGNSAKYSGTKRENNRLIDSTN